MPVCVYAHDYMTCFFACYPSCLVCWVIHLSYDRFYSSHLFCVHFDDEWTSESEKMTNHIRLQCMNDKPCWDGFACFCSILSLIQSEPNSYAIALDGSCYGRLFICYVVIESLFYSNTKQLCYNECRYKSASYSVSIFPSFYPSVTCSPKFMIPLSFYRMKCSLFRTMNLCTHIPKPDPILYVCELWVVCVCVLHK